MFDNEAVQALADPTHARHRAVVAHLEGVVSRRRRGRIAEAVVPTTVRVEAAYDRSAPGAAAINRFRLRDHALDTTAADTAARIQALTGVGPADAHIGATVRSLSSDEVVVLASDTADIAAACAPVPVNIVLV